jgi:hypothetical protein
MGLDLVPEQGSDGIRSFTKALLTDLRALEKMLDDDMIESGVLSIDPEEEGWLVVDRRGETATQ